MAGPRAPSPDFPFRFACRRSGNCCSRPGGAVRVGPGDVRRIAGHLGLSEEAFRSRYVAASGDRLVDGTGPRCVFLEDGRPAGCAIYPVRPERCRSWPFWDEHRNPRYLAEAARLCPGMEPVSRDGEDGREPGSAPAFRRPGGRPGASRRSRG